MTSAGILEEYHIAETKLAQARGEAWERQRQRVAEKVREKRQAKAGGHEPCDAAAQSTASVTRIAVVPASSADAGTILYIPSTDPNVSTSRMSGVSTSHSQCHQRSPVLRLNLDCCGSWSY
eukprot:gene16123-biopygen7144